MSRRPRNRWPEIAALRTQFEDLKWQAATTSPGFVLTRERRLLGAIYMLVPLQGQAVILYSLAEVRTYLNRHTTPTP